VFRKGCKIVGELLQKTYSVVGDLKFE
jgi:hypothetical protein